MSNIRTRGLQFIPWESREEWLDIRRGYIGGSNAAPIVGMSQWDSAFSVWAEKTGAVPEFTGNVATKVGNELEDFVAHLFVAETGKKVQRCNFTLVNPAYPFACANIDREVLGEDAILEIKTTSSWDVSKMTRNGEYPDSWLCQMTHYLAVTGCAKAYLAVLVECRELKIFELERDEGEITALMDAERDFWNTYVLPKKTPPTDGHSATTDAIKTMFPEEAGDLADLSRFADALAERKALKESIKRLEEGVDAIENEIKLQMGSAPAGKCGNYTVSWKLQRTGLDRDAIKADYPGIDFGKYATQKRVFRITEKKAKGE